jgi:dimethylglycine dehydrogenase
MRFWAEDGTPLDFGHDLFPDDLERIEENMMRAIDRVPAVGEAGIKRVINGPMIWSPDSNVLLGPVPELKNYFCCNGIIPGFSQSAGMGLMVAQWIIEGEMQLRHVRWDMARFGDWATTAPSPRPGGATSTPTASRSTSPTRNAPPAAPCAPAPPMRCKRRWARSSA